MVDRVLHFLRQLSLRELVITAILENRQMRQDFTAAVDRVNTALDTIPGRTQTAVALALQARDTEGTEMTNVVGQLAGRVEAAVAAIGPVSPPAAPTLAAGGGSDSILSGGGNDSLGDAGGNDSLFGGGGNDSLFGGGTNDSLGDNGAGDNGGV